MNQLSKVRVLLVDDSQELLDAYVALFTSLGFSAKSALDGQKAWEMLQDQEFDIVFTDIRMPIMDGVELMKKIRERHHLLPSVIVTSGYSDYPSDVLFHHGANGFLEKPVGASSIREAMARSMLKNEDQWAHVPKVSPTSTITAEFESFARMVDRKSVIFGNGGFFIPQEMPQESVLSIVNFSLNFTDEKSEISQIEGLGIIRWVHHTESEDRRTGVGIEIKYLNDSCRRKVFNWMKSQKLKSFIPMK